MKGSRKKNVNDNSLGSEFSPELLKLFSTVSNGRFLVADYINPHYILAAVLMLTLV